MLVGRGRPPFGCAVVDPQTRSGWLYHALGRGRGAVMEDPPTLAEPPTHPKETKTILPEAKMKF